jgi:hypothetical protein
LQFSVAMGNTADPDSPSPIITKDDMNKMQKMMEMKEKEISMDGKMGGK